jgi:hypothetical protein
MFKRNTANPKIRKEVLKRDKSKCKTCGLFYDLRLICAKLNMDSEVTDEDKSEEYALFCGLCYAIHKIKQVPSTQLFLCISKIPQNEIIIKYVEYYKKYKKIPGVLKIDKKAKYLPLSTPEYAYLLERGVDIPEFKKYKIFFSDKFDFSFLDKKKRFSKSTYSDTESDEEIIEEEEDDYMESTIISYVDDISELPHYELSVNELEVFSIFKS